MVVVDLGFCPRCGGTLEPCDGSGGHRLCCTLCDNVVFENPSPIVVATVVDDNHALFVRRARAPDKGAWSMPGGYLELGETLQEGAARELHEETHVDVDPGDLAFVGTEYVELGDNRAVVDLIFAVPREKTSGEPVAGDDADDVRYWTRAEIAENPPELRAGDPETILWAIDSLGTPERSPLW